MNRKVLRINKESNEVINEYSVRDDERIVIEYGKLLIMTETEYNKYFKGGIEDFELSDAPYYLEANEIFLVK